MVLKKNVKKSISLQKRKCNDYLHFEVSVLSKYNKILVKLLIVDTH